MNWLKTGAINGVLSVLLGAFGAHALKSQLTESFIDVYKTASQYHFFHSLALVCLGILKEQNSNSNKSQHVFKLLRRNKNIQRSGICFLTGIILFSGSLYLLAVSHLKFLGIITPLGGISFIIGWLFLVAASRK